MVQRGCGGLGAIIFLSIFVIIGMGLSIWGGNVLRNASASSNWPTVTGQVINSTVSENSDSDGTTYGADVYFEYRVNDQQYGSDTVSFGQFSSSDYGHARNIVNRYPEGTQVEVYYNPEDPETAVLEPGVTWSSYMLLGMGLAFICLPGFMMLIVLGNSIGLLQG